MEAARPVLQHLAIIPDGNRRWAKKHSIAGQKKIYEQGSDKTFEILEAALDMGIPHVTFWASSYTNLAGRPQQFVDAMEELYAQKFREMAKHPIIHRNKVRVEIKGQWHELLKPETSEALQSVIDATTHYDNQLLTILVGYDGHHERGAATLALMKDSMAGMVNLPSDAKAAETLLCNYAWTGHLPKVDLVIRTGAWDDPHNSAAFLSFLTGDSQYAYPQVLWPDFTALLFREILGDFAQRERRLGH